jgi:hypothetical protein
MGHNTFPTTHLAKTGAPKAPERREVERTACIKSFAAAFIEISHSVSQCDEGTKERKAAEKTYATIVALDTKIAGVVYRQVWLYGYTHGFSIVNTHGFLSMTEDVAEKLRWFSETRLRNFQRGVAEILWSSRSERASRTALARMGSEDGGALLPAFDKKREIASSNSNLSAIPTTENRTLCQDAELRMEDAKKKGMTTTVSTFLTVKFVGYIAALCTKTFRAANGTLFVEGVWYQPDKETYKYLQNEYESKRKYGVNIELPNATWSVIRAYDERNLNWR